MLLPTSYSATQTRSEPENGLSWEAGEIYDLLVCPACQQVRYAYTIGTMEWNRKLK